MTTAAEPRIAFVMEQILGHATWAANLRDSLERLGVAPSSWIETRLHREGGLPEGMPIPGLLRAGLRGLIDVRSGLAGHQYDVLLFNTQKAAMLCQAYMLRTPTILMTDVTPAQYDRLSGAYAQTTDGALIGRAKHAVNRLNFHLAKAIVPWSRWTAASFIDEYGIPSPRVHVIPPGVDTSLWRPVARPPSSRLVRLLFVGGDFVRKGGRLLLDVFAARGLRERAELHLVTRDPVDAPPGVRIHGALNSGSETLRALYASADVFVLPTLGDCFSIAAIEAMASGLPVVTSAVGGIPEIVLDGRTGFLLNPGDGRALADALEHLVEDAGLRSRFAVAGRERAVAKFDSRSSAARLLSIAARLARGSEERDAMRELAR